MTNEQLIRTLIKDSAQRAKQETAAAVLVVAAFGTMLSCSTVDSPRFWGCAILLLGAGLIVGVVWSYALSDRLLQSHPPSEVGFWRESFRAQATLLRLVPAWYAGPICVGGIIFAAPTSWADGAPFVVVAIVFVGVFAWCVAANRRAARGIEAMASQLS